MAHHLNGLAIVIMGVSGSGKSTESSGTISPEQPYLEQTVLTRSLVACAFHGTTLFQAQSRTIGRLLANKRHCDFLDADDFHPEENKEKMRQGVPLTDEDRMRWLETLRGALGVVINDGKTVILSCSALRFRYREILRTANQSQGSRRVKFFCLRAPVEVIEIRLKKREVEGGHFMPAALLQSQIDLLEIYEDEGIHIVDATLSPDAIVSCIQSLLS